MSCRKCGDISERVRFTEKEDFQRLNRRMELENGGWMDIDREGGLPAIESAEPGNEGVKWWAVNNVFYTYDQVISVQKIWKWYRRMKQRKFIFLVWRVMTPIYFHPSQPGGKKAIRNLVEFDDKILHEL